jgi:hypothetical protein
MDSCRQGMLRLNLPGPIPQWVFGGVMTTMGLEMTPYLRPISTLGRSLETRVLSCLKSS